eukprot:GHVS01029181.1.p1 GENE.GHVS01029181.1~~GHVS01029181.1.p1  ORF type:complete len:337 (+),score=24.62 GHVS01029181.1:37-1011(+)
MSDTGQPTEWPTAVTVDSGCTEEGRMGKPIVPNRRGLQWLLAALSLTALGCWWTFPGLLRQMALPHSPAVLSASHSTPGILLSTIPVSELSSVEGEEGLEVHTRVLIKKEEDESETIKEPTGVIKSVHVFYNPMYRDRKYNKWLNAVTQLLGKPQFLGGTSKWCKIPVTFHDTSDPTNEVVKELRIVPSAVPGTSSSTEWAVSIVHGLVVLLVEKNMDIVYSTIKKFRNAFLYDEVMFGSVPLGKGNAFATQLGWEAMDMFALDTRTELYSLVEASWQKLLNASVLPVYPRQLIVKVNPTGSITRQTAKETAHGNRELVVGVRA